MAGVRKLRINPPLNKRLSEIIDRFLAFKTAQAVASVTMEIIMQPLRNTDHIFSFHSFAKPLGLNTSFYFVSPYIQSPRHTLLPIRV